MDNESVAPCGVICDICLGFQRKKNKCFGCKSTGNKPYHCTVCSIKACPEKDGDESILCYKCKKFPCRRIRNLDKRYTTKYGESPIQNLETIKENGIKEFVRIEKEKWKCDKCGHLLCVHRETCLICGSKNQFFPEVK
ncbi:DUF3795 domain-containing protein [Marispirochaeta sp.]|uniref:DUF3795 domain-containing protein n=1 Tax=Marispirochaeta sp. TaxID=2038653 RepID=UPI0037493379